MFFFNGVLPLAGIAPAAFLLLSAPSFPCASALATPAPLLREFTTAVPTINASLVPISCTDTCKPTLSAQSTCGSNLTCYCTQTTSSHFATCMDCLVGAATANTLAQSAAQAVFSEYTQKCADNGSPVPSLTLSLAASPTGSSSPSNGAQKMVMVSSRGVVFAGVSTVVLLLLGLVS
ncbi:hypothetical protein FB45DRAFT_924149 [Roridomyces roridus]|uniref:Extracellular membrane protein CFEM domain-containing protein n=1 Tax=Roridomyces roridus TaxID=1738132 RepID=A0AAD7BLM5_9AGAR|nr:hypothetical protein FB45DRAFT_924149 [Roridomyces roridus]